MSVALTNAPSADGVEPAPASETRARRWAPTLCLALLAAVYFIAESIRASRQKLWYDEILTFDAASLLPSLHTLWAFLKHGIEFNPPLSFILSAISEHVFGANEFGLRFPSLVEFAVMAACLYIFLKRRLPWTFAMAGMLAPLLTPAARYSHEARPYALVLALGSIALVAWQAAAEGRRRALALAAIGTSLGAALCAQPLAVALALPFVAGEMARALRRKRVDWPMWCAFASATPALAILWMLKSSGAATTYSRFSGSFAGHLAATYSQLLSSLMAPVAIAAILLLLLRTQDSEATPAGHGFPVHELAALTGFALIPLMAVPVSALGGHYWVRYSLACVIGVGGLCAAGLHGIADRMGGAERRAGAAVLMVFGAWFVAGQFKAEGMESDGGVAIVNSSDEIQADLDRIPDDAPIVIGPAMTFIELEHYAIPRVAARLYYLTDAAAAAAIDGDTAFEVKGPLLARYFPFRAHFADYHAFVAAHKRFYVVRPIRNIAREYLAGRIDLQPRGTFWCADAHRDGETRRHGDAATGRRD